MVQARAACLVVAILLLGILGHVVATDPALRLTVRPAVGFAPQDLWIELRLQPTTTDRWLAVVCDGPDFSRSSTVPLEGAASAHFYSWPWRGFPPGDYLIVAEVGDGHRARAHDWARVTILGR